MVDINAFVPADMSQLAFFLLTLASLVTSFMTAAFGIGGGVVLIVVMALLVPPAALIPVHGIIQLGSNGGRVTIMATRRGMAPNNTIYPRNPDWCHCWRASGCATTNLACPIGAGHVYCHRCVHKIATYSTKICFCWRYYLQLSYHVFRSHWGIS